MRARQVLREVEDANNFIGFICLYLLLWNFLQPGVNNEDTRQDSG